MLWRLDRNDDNLRGLNPVFLQCGRKFEHSNGVATRGRSDTSGFTKSADRNAGLLFSADWLEQGTPYWQDVGCRNVCLYRSPEELEQDFDSLSGREHARDNCFQATQRASRNSDRLAHLDVRIYRHGLVFAGLFFQCNDRVRIDRCDIITELDQTPDSG